MAPEHPRASAIALRAERVAADDDERLVRRLKDPQTTLSDLDGKVMVPASTTCTSPLRSGSELNQCNVGDLDPVPSYRAAIQATLKAYAAGDRTGAPRT